MLTKLVQLIKQRAYREGDFTLASGQKSKFYINLKSVTLHPQGAELIGKLTVELCKKEGIHPEAVGGLTMGADPIATAVSLAAWSMGWEIPAFIVRKEIKGHGTREYIEGIENLNNAAKCLVVEDVSTTGASALAAVERLRAAGLDPRWVTCVVDREQGARELITRAGLSFYPLCTLSDIQKA